MQYIAVGAAGQWLVKPLLGLILALTLVPLLGLPNAVGTGLILVRNHSWALNCDDIHGHICERLPVIPAAKGQ